MPNTDQWGTEVLLHEERNEKWENDSPNLASRNTNKSVKRRSLNKNENIKQLMHISFLGTKYPMYWNIGEH
ncbi:12600_t:CDS:2 [Gigaspora margarita]|uniref:12600_t:CDS:1 n=1 Tax=Gigaspora margarita TaxID=4874 RepID=A0ABN7VAH2_GIGMA|nr:12600_t:CDS:2 [Gigaspora margarita]